MKKLAGIFSIVVGSSIIVLWSVLLLGDQVPELITEPASIYFHIAAEVSMAVLLIISGIGFLLQKSWSTKLFTLSAGLVVYSTINSSGYYAEKGDMTMVFMFSLLLVATIVILRKF